MLTEKRNTNENWVPVWFKIYKELNQPIHIHAFKINRFTNEKEYLTFDHSKTDGIDVAINVFKSDGWKITPPSNKPIKIPLFLKLISIFYYLYWARIRKVKWNNFDISNCKEAEPLLHRFNIKETQAILNWCKDHNTNITSLLLWSINNICNKLLVNPNNSMATWWMPVNIRNLFPADTKLNNLTSHIAVDISPKDTPANIRTKIRRSLRRLDFVGAWWWLQIGNIIGEKGMRSILQKQVKHNRWTGSLTNFGQWPMEGMIPPKDYPYVLVGSPPATSGHPIAVGVIIFYDELYITTSINNCILNSSIEAKKIFQDWIKLIQETSIGTSLPLP